MNHRVRMLLIAGALAMLQPVFAQETLPPITSLPPATPYASSPLPSLLTAPPLVNPELTMPRITDPQVQETPLPPARRPATSSIRTYGSVVFAADQAGHRVDLLAVPVLPSTWAVDALPAPPRLLHQQPMPSQQRPRLAAELTPLSQLPHTPTPSTSKPLAPVPTLSASKPLIPEKPTAWPPAFVEQQPSVPVVAQIVAHEEVRRDLQPAELQQLVARACGVLAKEVHVIIRPDHGILVHVQPINSSVERTLLERLHKIPGLAAQQVHLQFDVEP